MTSLYFILLLRNCESCWVEWTKSLAIFLGFVLFLLLFMIWQNTNEFDKMKLENQRYHINDCWVWHENILVAVLFLLVKKIGLDWGVREKAYACFHYFERLGWTFLPTWKLERWGKQSVEDHIKLLYFFCVVEAFLKFPWEICTKSIQKGESQFQKK